MPRKSVLYAVLGALIAALALTAAKPALSAAAPVKIMPLGDSITAGPGCWRALLWDRLQRTGYTGIDFVGTQPGGGCSVPHDGDHEGHGGFSATGIADNDQLPPWLAATKPDIVLMHLGTNDMWGGYIPTTTVLAAYTKLIGQMRAANPKMKIIVAQIIPMNPPSCPTCAADVVALDNAIPAWAAGLTTAQSPIVVVDQWTGFDAARDTGDGVHPNDAGFQKMADRWYPALTKVLDGITPPLPSPSPSPSPSVSPAPVVSPSPGAAGCSATYRVVSQWSGGFQGEVSVRNDTAAAMSGWTATFSFGGGQQITQAWNATVSQSGAAVTARNLSWNGVLPAGGSTGFGFLASWNGGNTAPVVSCRAG
ncbi:cellulose binding domain-containing protein [Microbispora sp. H10836]|uniref:cellulose binding domain-containing protein n=1 Tax=Microbispora sp. H10836 TaxID=2729106 RepID=UPI0020166E99|nr:cellulose binding domain-containing protein [Microbispora sp. H10836]